MRIHNILYLIIAALLLLQATEKASAQKPLILNQKEGEDSSWMTRPVPASVLAHKKYTLARRLYQNLITRFNSYYNAKTKLGLILEQAEKEHHDNFDSLLSIHPYGLRDFSSMGGNLDSVIYTASYGIQIHDPRSKWIDNLYLIAGKAYYFKRDYANAVKAFKYIIRNEGAKTKEGEAAVIGSRGETPESQISVATPEKKKLFYHRPSRNDAFIWLIRTYTDSGAYDQAISLLSVLNSDPQFPVRLQKSLAVASARLYFRQGLFTKGVPFLEKAAALQHKGRLKARWQFLLGQLDESTGDVAGALSHYTQVVSLPTDPMMHFHAYLNMTELHILQDKEDFATGSSLLLHMARKEKYDRYRSIIYYNLAGLALKAGLPDKAIPYLQESLLHNPENTAQKLASCRLLADTYYATGKYRMASMYYDSTLVLAENGTPQAITGRTEALRNIVKQMDVIKRQDSLQRLASLPPDQLQALLQEVLEDSLRARRKRNMILGKASSPRQGMQTPGETASAGGQQAKGGRQSWYFYNSDLRAKGFSLFRSRWGKRALADNWRGGTSVSQPGNTGIATAAAPAVTSPTAGSRTGAGSIEALMAGIPLKPEQKKASDDSVIHALYSEAAVFADNLGNDTASARLLDTLLIRFAGNSFTAAACYRLQLIYTRLGQPALAAHYRQLLFEQFPDSKFAAALSQGAGKRISGPARLATRLYDSAYLSYLGGQYDRVLALRDSARKVDPAAQKARFDLLGAMVLVKQQADSAAKRALHQVISADKQDTAIARQAAAILAALSRKQQLIEHLAHLQLPAAQQVAVTRPPAATPKDTVRQVQTAPPAAAKPVAAAPAKPATDSSAATKVAPPPATPYKLDAAEPHFVILAFTHNDKKTIDQCLDKFSAYNSKTASGKGIEVSSYVLGQNHFVLIFRLFPDEASALRYEAQIRQKAPAIVSDVPPSWYRFFIISRDNFILLNNSKDYQGYLQFFSRNYR
jgi:tetratricopeptide (TPR) repeat protein